MPIKGKFSSKKVKYNATILLIRKNSIKFVPPQETIKQDTANICIASEIKSQGINKIKLIYSHT